MKMASIFRERLEVIQKNLEAIPDEPLVDWEEVREGDVEQLTVEQTVEVVAKPGKER